MEPACSSYVKSRDEGTVATSILIQERCGLAGGRNAIVSFDGQGEYEVTVANPFSEKEEKELEWYFEEHLRFPFVDGVRAREAAASVQAYGEALFVQIFQQDPRVLRAMPLPGTRRRPPICGSRLPVHPPSTSSIGRP